MSFATARPAKPGQPAPAKYRTGYAVIPFDGGAPKPHPVIIRSSDGLMVPATHNPSGWRRVALPINWLGDGDTRPGYMKPEWVGHWPLTALTKRFGLGDLATDLYGLADQAFLNAGV